MWQGVAAAMRSVRQTGEPLMPVGQHKAEWGPGQDLSLKLHPQDPHVGPEHPRGYLSITEGSRLHSATVGFL